MIAVVAISTVPAKLSYADGHFVENRPYMPSEHSLSLAYNITNTNTNNETHTIFALGLFDEEQQEFVRFVTYGIEVYEVLDKSEKRIMEYDRFHAVENETLILDITQIEGETQVFGSRHNFLNSWIPDPQSGSIKMFMNLEQDANYLMHVEVIGADDPRDFFPLEEIASVDIYFNVNEDDSGEVMIVPGELVVVPEFPYHIVLVISAVIGSIIAISRTELLARFYSS